ncbi:hypothetical protein GCK72_026187 [Caenorhabditis remanei]|uniref:Uncharacterized protein n=1 Tax=Caenorhabditis remanei TaxID=31234 RepID=A0A6A5G5E3_CAERE|nr:hypothetical protein GCK72_026187 [Caenorhabditis remanei]KAF1749719.1 hypothetical protein GCK72_026187 [Caenorhabditis remanei]
MMPPYAEETSEIGKRYQTTLARPEERFSQEFRKTENDLFKVVPFDVCSDVFPRPPKVQFAIDPHTKMNNQNFEQLDSRTVRDVLFEKMSSPHYQPRTARTEPAAPQVWGPTLNVPQLPEEDPNRKMTMKEYFSVTKIPPIRTQKWNTINIPAKEKELLKLVILDSISRRPDILDIKNTSVIRLEYAIVAIQVFKRTGHILSSQLLMYVFKRAKEQLRIHLRAAISTKLRSPAEVEQKLRKWPVYEFIRFYRVKLQDWEAQFRQKYITPADGQPVVFEIDEDQFEDVDEEQNQEMSFSAQEELYEGTDIVGEATHQSESPPALLTANIKSEPHQPLEDPTTSGFPGQLDQVGQMNDTEDHDQIGNQEMRIPANISNVTDDQIEDMKDFEISMDHITHQANCVARRQPEKIDSMRQAMFLAVLEMEKSDATDLGEFFAGMAKLHTRK